MERDKDIWFVQKICAYSGLFGFLGALVTLICIIQNEISENNALMLIIKFGAILIISMFCYFKAKIISYERDLEEIKSDENGRC